MLLFRSRASTDDLIGSKCGSIDIDLAFKKWLKDLQEKNYLKLDQAQLGHRIRSHYTEGEPIHELVKRFDQYKRRFNHGHQDITIDLPDPLHNLNVANKAIEGEITVTKFVISDHILFLHCY